MRKVTGDTYDAQGKVQFRGLLEIMAKLRENGCPWDKEQTMRACGST